VDGLKFCFLFLLFLLAGCTKESTELRIAQLSVEGEGVYLITYGLSDEVTVKGEDLWSTSLNVNPGDTIHLLVKTAEAPATLYMRVEVQEGLLFCKSLYIEPQSTGKMNHIVGL
jgi:hypothetical protein